jgi:hypothetical protein
MTTTTATIDPDEACKDFLAGVHETLDAAFTAPEEFRNMLLNTRLDDFYRVVLSYASGTVAHFQGGNPKWQEGLRIMVPIVAMRASREGLDGLNDAFELVNVAEDHLTALEDAETA